MKQRTPFSPILRWLFRASFLWAALPAAAQCPNNNALVGSAITVPCPGTVSPAPCLKGGQYALVNVVSGNTYTFSTCGQNAFNTFLTLYNNAGGPSLASDGNACGNQSAITWTATFTGSVRILVDRQRPSTNCDDSNNCTPVAISCVGPPVNDNPCGAIALPVGTACNALSPNPVNTGATPTAGIPAPGCANYNGGDVWFTVTVPATGSVTVTTTEVNNSPFYDSGLALYTSSNGTCAGTFTLVAGSCNDDIDFPYNEMSSSTVTGMTPGTVLFVRVWESNNNQFGAFNICATNLPGDAPCQAAGLTVNSSCTYITATNQGATRTTTPGNPGCNWNTGTARDIWFTFTAPANGHVIIQSAAGSLTNGSMALYSTSNDLCSGTWNLIACNDNFSLTNPMPFLDRTGLTPGRPYWIRYWGYNGSQGTFNICIYSPTANPSADCSGGITVCDAQNVNNNSLSTGNNDDLNSANHGCLLNDERQGTWFAYQAGANGSLGFSITPVASDDYDFAVWGPYPSGSTTATMCVPANAPIRCSYAQRNTTYSATNAYATGMGNSNTSFNNPRFAPPSPCPTCSQNLNGNGWVPGITVTAGQVYLLYVDNWSQSGSAFDLSWTLLDANGLPNPDLLNCAVVLPVQFLSVGAEVKGPTIEVAWATASEAHSDHFEVERSADNLAFEPIGSVAAAGTSQQRIDYLFVDKDPMDGANYYRLKQVDIDGAFELTQAVVAVFGRKGLVPLLFPNPARDVLHVAFDTPVDGYTLIYVRDALGRVVGGPEALLERGQRTVDLPTDRLAPGFYTVRVALASGEILNGGGFMKQ